MANFSQQKPGLYTGMLNFQQQENDMKTTLNKIREHSPCNAGWVKLLRHLGKTQADDEPLTILEILNSNGLDYALRCLRAVDGYEKEMRLYAVWCARQMQHLMTDSRSIAALDVAERHAHGQATDDELAAASAAAWSAASDAAWSAAWPAASAAASAAALAAAENAASDAASAAAWDATRAAASDATRAAASDAAWSAAWDAARTEARAAQENQLRKVLAEIQSTKG